jgi:hypothetical protein
MTSVARTTVQGKIIRATLVDECGEVVVGACAYATSRCFASVSMSDNVEAGEEFKVKAADGLYCTNQRSSPLLNWIEVGITLLQVDPELVAILTGSPVVYDGDGNAVGFQTTTDAFATASFALEVWTGIGKDPYGTPCSGEDTLYGYLLLPWLVEGATGEMTIENGAANLVINAITSNGNQWGTGPYDVVKTALGAPSPLLEALPSTAHRHMQWTEIAPPAAAAGCQALDAVS